MVVLRRYSDVGSVKTSVTARLHTIDEAGAVVGRHPRTWRDTRFHQWRVRPAPSGHVRYLQDARQLGDVLMVGLNRIAPCVRTRDRTGRSPRGRARRDSAGARMRRRSGDFRRRHARCDHQACPARRSRERGGLGPDNIVGRDTVEARGGRVVRMELSRGYSTTDRDQQGEVGFLKTGSPHVTMELPMAHPAFRARRALRM